ncbi:hypothetical protein LY76DRAFT_303751 [Colletotrichum caudatum]|nr:hypothetical protein LY76DRAFT_303751 [Colletotrichum caudatum]
MFTEASLMFPQRGEGASAAISLLFFVPYERANRRNLLPLPLLSSRTVGRGPPSGQRGRESLIGLAGLVRWLTADGREPRLQAQFHLTRPPPLPPFAGEPSCVRGWLGGGEENGVLRGGTAAEPETRCFCPVFFLFCFFFISSLFSRAGRWSWRYLFSSFLFFFFCMAWHGVAW